MGSPLFRVGSHGRAAGLEHRCGGLWGPASAGDLDRSKALLATPGREAATVTAFIEGLKAHGGAATNIRQVACGMGVRSGSRDPNVSTAVALDNGHKGVASDRTEGDADGAPEGRRIPQRPTQ